MLKKIDFHLGKLIRILQKNETSKTVQLKEYLKISSTSCDQIEFVEY